MISSKKVLIAVLVFPILILAGLTIYKQRIVSFGKTVHFLIDGYDPRDLLSGHYLIYRVNYALENICGASDEPSRPAYVCLQPRFASLDEVPSHCERYIRGSCEHHQFKAGIERFYVPESEAGRMEREVRAKKASIAVSVSSSGDAQVVDLFIDGESWRNVVAKRPEQEEPIRAVEPALSPTPAAP